MGVVSEPVDVALVTYISFSSSNRNTSEGLARVFAVPAALYFQK
jgi:hypothetical protein